MKKHLSLLLVSFCLILMLSSVTIFASADIDWPTKPVTLICGYSAGGSSDIGSRFVAASLEKYLGQPVVVQNMPGAASGIAWNYLLNSAPKDGYTFALVNLNIMFGEYNETNPRDYNLDDFELLANQAIDYNSLSIHNDDPRFSDFESLVEYAKENEILANGYGTGISSNVATNAKALINEYGLKITTVPLSGGSEGETMFLSGDLDLLILNVGDTANSHNNGTYKNIAVFSSKRSEFCPDVPTAKELGMNHVNFSGRGYAYAKGVDEKIVNKMTDALAKAISDSEHIKNMEKVGIGVELYSGVDYTELMENNLDSRLKIWGFEKKK